MSEGKKDNPHIFLVKEGQGKLEATLSELRSTIYGDFKRRRAEIEEQFERDVISEEEWLDALVGLAKEWRVIIENEQQKATQEDPEAQKAIDGVVREALAELKDLADDVDAFLQLPVLFEDMDKAIQKTNAALARTEDTLHVMDKKLAATREEFENRDIQRILVLAQEEKEVGRDVGRFFGALREEDPRRFGDEEIQLAELIFRERNRSGSKGEVS